MVQSKAYHAAKMVFRRVKTQAVVSAQTMAVKLQMTCYSSGGKDMKINKLSGKIVALIVAVAVLVDRKAHV